MHVRTQRRQNLRHLHPAILLEICGNNFIGVLDVAARRKGHRLWHLQEQIRLTVTPAFHPGPGRRRILRFPSGRLRFSPRRERLDLRRPQRWVIRKPSYIWISEPRGHGFLLRGAADGVGEWPRLSVRFEGHRGDAPGVVATLAMLLEDGQHIAIKARGIPCGSLLRKRSAQPPKKGPQRASEQETYEILGWRELACGFDARPPSAVARSFKVHYFLFLPVASPTGRGKTGICLVGTANTIVFEARAYISYNVEFVYGRGRFIGWQEQKIRASWGIASFWGSSSWSSEAACCFTSFRSRRSAARSPPKPWPRSGTSRLACRMCASSSTRSSSAIRT